MTPGEARPYRSHLRRQRAAETRAAVVEAASALFEEQGFAGTTVAEVAKRAGVSAQTVYTSFGGKAGLVRAIVEGMEESADAALWRERIAAESNPAEILAAFAQWTAAFFSASRPVLDLARGVAAELVDLMNEGNAHRRKALEALIARLAEDGAIRVGPDEAVDRAWLLTGVETFALATQSCGWSVPHYAQWLAETLADQVLAPELRRPPPGASGGRWRGRHG